MTEKKNNGQILALIASTHFSEETTNSLENAGIVVWNEHHNVNELTNFGTLIVSPMSTKDISNDNAVVERAIIRILENGGHVCILLDVKSSEDTIINHVLLAASTKLIPFTTPIVETDVKRSEFWASPVILGRVRELDAVYDF